MFSLEVMMMTKGNICSNCRFFNGFDGINEVWTDCDIKGFFPGSRNDCKDFQKKGRVVIVYD